MDNKKILVLGAKGFPKVQCFDWDDKIVPNIPDYDIVIINVVSLTKSEIEDSIQREIRNGVKTLLNTRGTLVAIGCPQQKIRAYTNTFQGKKPVEQWNYLWCPIPLDITNETGTSFIFEDDVLKGYFRYVKKWTYCFDVPPVYTKIEGVDIPLKASHAVKNRYDKYLACNINHVLPHIGWRSGDFIFLPCPTELTAIEAVRYILEKFFSIYQKTPPPEWAKSIQIPGLIEIQESIEDNLQKIRDLAKENNRLNEKQSELICYKELLYETGTALEEIVKKIFTRLGYTPKPPIHREEYVIEFDKKIGIIECKGKDKSIDRDDFRQLLDYTKEYDLDSKFEHKGILIGNGWRLLPLQERDKSRTPIFPKGKDGVVDIAAKHDIALVSATGLFKAFCSFLEGQVKSSDIIETIFNSKGVVDFDNFAGQQN
jgi:hypothetical protein